MANFDDITNFDQVVDLDNYNGSGNMAVVKYIAFSNNKQILKQIKLSEINNDDSSYTIMGNTFNGVSELVKLDEYGDLPSLNGKNLTGLAGEGLEKNSTSGALDIVYDDSTITIINNALVIKDDGVTAAKINADVAGAGLVQNGTSGALDVNVDDSTLEVDTDV